MEKFRGGRGLLFYSLIVIFFRLARNQGVTTHKIQSVDLCENTEESATCRRMHSTNPNITCLPSCPTQWTQQLTDLVFGNDKEVLQLKVWFMATAAWNGTIISCTGEPRTRKLIVRSWPKVNLRFANEVLWIGLNQNSSCQADEHCAGLRRTSFEWNRRCADPLACGFQVLERTSTGLVVTFTSTDAWNHSVVSCTMKSGGLQISEERILTVYALPALAYLPADAYFLEGVNVTLSCFTVGYFPPSIHLVLRWKCMTACPGDADDSKPGKMAFKATSKWDGVQMQCVSEGNLPHVLNTEYPAIIVIYVRVVINLKYSPTLIGEHQQVRCRSIGNYRLIMASHPMELNVMCRGAGCNFTTNEIKSGEQSGEDLNEESSKVSLSFVADTTWNDAEVNCKLRGSSLAIHKARLTINTAEKTTIERLVKEHSATMASNNSSDPAEVAARDEGLKTVVLVLAFCSGTLSVIVAAFISRTLMLVLWRLKCRCFGQLVSPSNDSSDEAHSIDQARSQTSRGNQGLATETTVQ